MMKMYRLIDVRTNNVLENLQITEVVKALGVSRGCINSAVKKNNLIRMRYKVEVEELDDVDFTNKNIPVELWREWDRVCSSLKVVLKKYGKNIVITQSVE